MEVVCLIEAVFVLCVCLQGMFYDDVHDVFYVLFQYLVCVLKNVFTTSSL